MTSAKAVKIVIITLSAGILAVLPLNRTCNGANPISPHEMYAVTQPEKMLHWGQNTVSMFAVGMNNLLHTWEWRAGRMHHVVAGRMPDAGKLQLLSNGEYLATTRPADRAKEAPLVIGELATGQPLAVWEPPIGWVYDRCGISSNGRFGTVLLKQWPGDGMRIGVIDVNERKLEWVVKDIIGEQQVLVAGGMAISHDGHRVAVAGWNHGVAMYGVKTRRREWAERPPKVIAASDVLFSADGSVLYFGDGGGSNAFALDSATGKVLRKFEVGSGTEKGRHGIVCMMISQDSTLLAVGTAPQGLVLVYDLTKDGDAVVLQGLRGRPWAVSFSPDSKHVAALGGGQVVVWRVRR